MAIKNKPQIVPAVPSRTAGNREAAMPVEYDVHHRPRITVADGSGTPSAAPNKPGQPSPGNANAPAGQLPNIKADPKRATRLTLIAASVSCATSTQSWKARSN